MSAGFGVASYASAAVAYLAVLALVLPSKPATWRALGFVAVIAASALWSGALALALYLEGGFRSWMLVADAARALAWIGFIGALLRARAEGADMAGRFGSLLWVAGFAFCAVVAFAVASAPAQDATVVPQALPLGLLALALLGLLGIEQLFRNAVYEQRHVLRPLCTGVGLVFAVDIFVFSEVLLLRQIDLPLWLLRGLAGAAAAPLLLLAVKRQPDWGRGVFVSRHIVFYTATLIGAGLYLLAMAVGGFLIAAKGASWRPWLQLMFFVAAAGVLFFALFSVSMRRRLKVFIAKHFYRNRYDYREEWLRFIETLAGHNDGASLPARSVKALAEIIGSPRGELWLASRDGRTYEPYGAWRAPVPSVPLSKDDALVRFLDATRWVIDTKEYQEDPEKYSNAFAADPAAISSQAIIVPLMRAGGLAGIVRLERSAALGPLSYEDHDLLKTAGLQVAVFLEQDRVQEELSETRQFEAFNRLTAFLMHDLKNLIAQQELVVGNAQRFKHRPEFIEDAVRTIESSVQRMKKVLDRLQSGERHDRTSLVRVERLLQDVCGACSDRAPQPRLGAITNGVRVAMDRDKLAMAVTHAVRNAQDATGPDGRVELRLGVRGGLARIEVEDTGCGMDSGFVRHELFKPFRSTKGAKGMGIGAYQIRETLRSVSGDVEVRSELGKGTTVCMLVPVVAVEPEAGKTAA